MRTLGADYFPSAVGNLQTALNRFAVRMGQPPLTVSGSMDYSTYARFQQVVVLFMPDSINGVFRPGAGGLIGMQDVQLNAQTWADLVNAAADSWGDLLSPPTSTETAQFAAALSTAGAPALSGGIPWVWIGGGLIVVAGAYLIWRRRRR